MFNHRGDTEGSADQVKNISDIQPIDRSIRERFEVEALKHLDSVYRVAVILCSSGDDVEDLVQETFIRAFQAFGGFELRDYGAKPWLLRILHNTFYSYKGKQRRSPVTLDDMDFDQFAQGHDLDDQPLSVSSFNWEAVDEKIKTAMFELQPEYQMVLMLWAIEGRSYQEISEICDCALGTVMSRLYRARRLLGQQLRDFAKEHNWSTKRIDK